MRFLMAALIALMSTPQPQAQDIQARRSRYMERAEVLHFANSATLTANSPRPLAQAVTALSETYGWVIDFEDPPYYSKYDLVDDTDSKWRAEHPSAKGVTAIAGDKFQSQFSVSPNTGTSVEDEERILEKVISDYNQSANPGKFAVRNEGGGRFAVVGTNVKDETGHDQAVVPILDTRISIQEGTRDAFTTLKAILGAVTATGQPRIGLGTAPLNALSQSQVTAGGRGIPARVLLAQTLSAAKVKLYWHLYYDHDVQMYMLNVLSLID